MSKVFDIRPFDEKEDADYEAFVAVMNDAHPDHRRTAEEVKSQDERRDLKCRQERFFAQESGGAVVGVGFYGQPPWAYHPDRYFTHVAVRPDAQAQGAGSALYRHLQETLSPLNPETLRCQVHEDKKQAVRFACARDFVEDMREWESRLEVNAFDPAPFATARQKATRNGIIIQSLRELEGDTERNRKVWKLESETTLDVPTTETLTPLSFEQFERQVIQDSNLLLDGFFVAIEEATGKYIGASSVWKSGGDSDLHTGFTSVHRDHRRKGIALAMKLTVIEWAKASGYGVIRTENATTNRAMLSINEALGFVKQPALIHMINHVRPESRAAAS